MASHNHVGTEAGDRRVLIAVLVNLGLTAAQIAGGVIAGSLALVADAIHNLSDAISLAIAFVARKIAKRPPDEEMTYGYGRAEIVAALVNYTTLILIGLYLIYEAILRFIEPQGVDGWIVIVIAALALAVDTVTAALTYALSKQSVNIRAAFLHNLADALGSIGVIVAGTLILLYDWRLLDPAVTVLIATYILWQSFAEIGGVIRILMLGSPPDVDAGRVVAALGKIDGVSDIHHVHLWQIDEHQSSLEAHVAISADHWGRADAIKAAAKSVLEDEFGIEHSMLELECSRHRCDGPATYGHEQAGADHRHGRE